MSILNDWYGEFVGLYCGAGRLNGEICRFEIGQMKDGTIVLFCTIELRPPHGTETVEIELAGIAENEMSVYAKGKVSASNVPLGAGSFYVGRGPFDFFGGRTGLDASW